MTTGEKIRNLRKKANMSQDAFAEALEVSRQAVSKWENNETKPDTTKLILISELFHVSTDYLLKDETTSDQEQNIPDIFNHRFFRKWKTIFQQKGYHVGYAISLFGLFHLLSGLIGFFILKEMISNIQMVLGGSFFTLPLFIQLMFIAVCLICLFGLIIIITGFVLAHKLKNR